MPRPKDVEFVVLQVVFELGGVSWRGGLGGAGAPRVQLVRPQDESAQVTVRLGAVVQLNVARV